MNKNWHFFIRLFRFAKVRSFSIIFFLILSAKSYAQETRVISQNGRFSTTEKPVIVIKWYSKDLVYTEGVNIYRKQEGSLNWEKINTRPIIRKTSVAPSVLQNDPDMETFVNLVKSATKQQLQEDIVLFNVLLKSFQSEVFADFMGIYYEDVNVQAGSRYQYKVSKLDKGREFIVGVSPVTEAGKFQAPPPVENVEVFQKAKTINLNWKHEDDRFYAVNIYRKSSADTVTLKLNKTPLMLSQITDSLGRPAYPKPMFSENVRLVEDQVYSYQLAGVDFFGNETQRSRPVNVSFNDVTPPPAPQEMTGKADSMKVYLQWQNISSPDFRGLHIYRSRKSDGPFEIINPSMLTVGVTSYVDSLQLPGPYYYFVASVDKANNEGHSNMIFVEVQDVIPPVQPEHLQIKTDTGKISLTWKMNEEKDLAGYYIYRTVNKDSKRNYILLNAIPLTENHFEQELPKNVKNKFFYYVVAVDTSYNKSNPSLYVSGSMPDVLPPEKPFIKSISYSEENIVIEWIQNIDTDLAGYHIYRSDTSRKFEKRNINLLGRETFRYTDRDHQSNTDYFYYIEAVDSAGNTSPHSKEVYARRIEKGKQASAKLDLKIKSKKGKQNQLSWEFPLKNDVLGFVVYRGETQSHLQPMTGLIKTMNYIDKKSKEGNARDHYYQVRAYVGSEIVYSEVLRQKL